MSLEMSAEITEFAAALLAFQAAATGVVKDSKNPHFKNRYASLEAVIDEARPKLQSAGLAWMQAPGRVTNGNIALTTILIHAKSGQWIKSTMEIPLGKNDPQGAGSATTYAQRYALMATLGLPPVDDDGESAMDRSTPSAPPRAESSRANTAPSAARPAAPLSAEYGEFVAEMKRSRSKAELREWWFSRKDNAARLPEGESLMLVGERNTLAMTLPEFAEAA